MYSMERKVPTSIFYSSQVLTELCKEAMAVFLHSILYGIASSPSILFIKVIKEY